MSVRRRPVLAQSETTRLREGRYGYLLYNYYDDTIGRAVDLYGEWADAECELLRRYIGEGDVVLDIGANIGTHMLFFSSAIGPRGRVYAFEPQHEIFQIMAANAALNGRRNVRAFRAGVAERSGELSYVVPDYASPSNFGAFTLSMPSVAEGPRETAPIVTVDSFGFERVALMKVDVEGMELAVLRGAEETIARCSPVIYAENTDAGRSVQVITWLLARGYRIFWHTAIAYNPSNYAGETENIFGNASEPNILCLPAGHPVVPEGLHEVTRPDEYLSV